MSIDKVMNSFINLIHLYGSIDKQTEIVKAKTNDLNGILEPQGVPDQEQFVDQTKNVKGEERRYSLLVIQWGFYRAM